MAHVQSGRSVKRVGCVMYAGTKIGREKASSISIAYIAKSE
jgi:hypothetical protein